MIDHSLYLSAAALPQHYAPLLDARIDESDPRFDDYVAVMEFEPLFEIFASPESRDNALGPASEYLEFVHMGECPSNSIPFAMWQIAIGHNIDDIDFSPVANVVLSAQADFWRDFSGTELSQMTVVIDRTRYILTRRNELEPEVVIAPMYDRLCSEREVRTASWLKSYFSTHWPVAEG